MLAKTRLIDHHDDTHRPVNLIGGISHPASSQLAIPTSFDTLLLLVARDDSTVAVMAKGVLRH